MLANRLGWFSIDPGYAAAGILLLAGLGLVIGGIAASRRRRTVTDDGEPVASVGDGIDAAPTATTAPATATKPNPYAPGPRTAGPTTSPSTND